MIKQIIKSEAVIYGTKKSAEIDLRRSSFFGFCCFLGKQSVLAKLKCPLVKNKVNVKKEHFQGYFAECSPWFVKQLFEFVEEIRKILFFRPL